MYRVFISFLLVFILAAGLAFLYFKRTPAKPPPQVNPIVTVMATPTPVNIPSGVSEKPNLLTPQPGSKISGPLVIRGYVPKSWTFEGQFRMKIKDDNRKLILQDRVPVEWDENNTKNSLYFVESYNYHTTAKSGFLVLENDNPSGLPENQKSIEIPIVFSVTPKETVYLFRPSTKELVNTDYVDCGLVIPEAFSLGITKTPIRDTINTLARRMHPDFVAKSVNLKNGLLTIEFPDIFGFTTGGSCQQGLNTAQVVKTALQFPEVKEVRITPESIFQP